MSWWDNIMDGVKKEGAEHAEIGVFYPPYPGSDDPEDEDYNRAYQEGFNARRKELGDKFQWA